ncbi:MAG: Gfo/Idh/MocA family oxidoreductase, partial [candidate division WOR-3 bacterium]
MNRRRFISNSALSIAGIGLTGMSGAAEKNQAPAPSDKINVGLIGCRNMGFRILQHHLSNPGINCVALCDVDEKILNERAAEVQNKFSQKPVLYKDFRKLLERKDLDAVIVGTPDHWHCLI